MQYDDIIKAIDDHLSKSQKRYYRDFFIGITDDVANRLFGYHKVIKQDDWWIYCNADTDEIAQRVEKHYKDRGMDSGIGNCNDNSKFVYCYEITDKTKEHDE